MNKTNQTIQNKQKRVLVVDDDGHIRTLLSEALLRRGFAVDTAENGKAALEKLAKKNFEMALLDIKMPEMDGFETAKAISLRCPETFVVAMTGKASVEEIEKTLCFTGHYVCLHKPFTMTEFAVIVKALEERAAEHREKKLSRKLKSEPPALQKIISAFWGKKSGMQSAACSRKVNADIAAAVFSILMSLFVVIGLFPSLAIR